MATLTTPVYAFPSPDGAERVMDGDNAIGALALAVENVVKPLGKPAGVIVSGALTAVAVGAPVALDISGSPIAGSAAWMDVASDRLVVPVGLGGLYLLHVWGTFSVPIPAGTSGIVRIAVDAGNIGSLDVLPAASRYTFMGITQLAAGQALQVTMAAVTSALSSKIDRFGVVRLGDAFAV